MTLPEAERILAASPLDYDIEPANLGSAAFVTGDTARAWELSTKALAEVRNPSTLLNVAVIMETYGRFHDALPLIREAYALAPGNAEIGVMLANSLLRLGDWTRGWPLYVEHQANFSGTLGTRLIPEWKGESLKGKRVLVFDGGGYGDNIFFYRWIPQLRRLGCHITLKVPPHMGPLTEQLPIQAILGGGEPNVTLEMFPRDYDYFIPLLSLPLHFGITLENYRSDGPYLFGTSRHSIRPGSIGICWKAGELETPRRHRSLLREQTLRILSVLPSKRWVSLVVDEPPPVEILSPIISHWQDTADVIASLSLVVTTDTGVAHLAGALGVPTYVILPGISAWQYLLGSESHPLYPSVRLFRNVGEGLDNAVDACSEALRCY